MKQELVILGGQTIDQKLRVWQVGAQASKFGFWKLIVCIIKKKKCHGVKLFIILVQLSEPQLSKSSLILTPNNYIYEES